MIQQVIRREFLKGRNPERAITRNKRSTEVQRPRANVVARDTEEEVSGLEAGARLKAVGVGEARALG